MLTLVSRDIRFPGQKHASLELQCLSHAPQDVWYLTPWYRKPNVAISVTLNLFGF